MSKALMRFQI